MTSKNNILPFFASANSGSSLYLAVKGEPEGGFLSPRVMQWSSDQDIPTLLIDLSPTLRYWKQQSTERNLTLEELLVSLLPSMTAGVLASHPWQAVLHLKTLTARGNNDHASSLGHEMDKDKAQRRRGPEFTLVNEDRSQGSNAGFAISRPRLINLNGAFGQNLSRDLSWDAWWQTCHEIAAHWQTCGRKSDTLVRNLRSMSQTVERMQIESPAQFLDTSDSNKSNLINQMQRRFGVQLAQLWNWTWQDHNETSAAEVVKDDFPWRFIKHKETPETKRLLEQPLRDWEHIEPFLCEDLDRICNLACWNASERVVSLEWVLSFSNSPTLTIPVLFRHPHCLHREATHHKTALLQAFYSWKSVLQKKLKDSHFKEDSLYLDNDSVTEWTLAVSERLIVPNHTRSLFMDDLNSPSHKLREIENTLPCPIERFDLTADWTPGDSWTTVSDETPTFESLSLPSFTAQHCKRPLFIYPKPQAIQSRRSSGLIFQERVMRKWWEYSKSDHPPSTQDAMRDYYLRMEDDGVLQWAFCDNEGKFFIHGIYG